MDAPPETWGVRWTRRLLLAGAFVFLARWLRIALSRLTVPFDLEWLEGVSVDHLERLMAGLPLYAAPSVDWVPFSYPPLYYLAAAPIAALTGTGYVPLRLVSILASLGSMGVLAVLVSRETRSRCAGFVAAGLFAATFRLGGAWFDVARVDSLFLFLVLLSLALIVRGTGQRSAAAAGVALALAALTKQTAMGVAPALFVAALPDPRRAVTLTLVCAAVWFPAVGALHHTSDGWFTYYAFQLPSRHYEYNCAPHFWTADVLHPLPIASVLALAFSIATVVTRRFDLFARYVIPSLSLVLSSWISRRHCGGYDNVLIPLHAALALLSALALSSHAAGLARRVVLVALVAQLALLNYDDAAQIPPARDHAAYEDLLLRIRSTAGDVWCFQHSRLPRAAGKRTFAHWMAICDVLRDPRGDTAKTLWRSIYEAVEARRFGAVITNDDYFPVPIGRRYTWTSPVFSALDVFFPVTGMRTRPQVWWRRD